MTMRQHSMPKKIALLSGFMMAFGGIPVVGSMLGGPAIDDPAGLTIQQRASEPSSDRRLTFHRARRPIVVPVDLYSEAGTLQVSADAVAEIVGRIDSNPGRLVTLKFEGAPLRFADLPRATRDQLIERSGMDVADRYDLFLSNMVAKTLERARSLRPRSALSVQGLPFEGPRASTATANRRYAKIIESLDALVMSKVIVLSRFDAESTAIERAYPNSFRNAVGRALLYPANRGWRIAIDTDRLASDQGKRPAAPSDANRGIEDRIALGDGSGDEDDARSLASPAKNDLASAARPSSTAGASASDPGSGPAGVRGAIGGGGGSATGGGGGVASAADQTDELSVLPVDEDEVEVPPFAPEEIDPIDADEIDPVDTDETDPADMDEIDPADTEESDPVDSEESDPADGSEDEAEGPEDSAGEESESNDQQEEESDGWDPTDEIDPVDDGEGDQDGGGDDGASGDDAGSSDDSDAGADSPDGSGGGADPPEDADDGSQSSDGGDSDSSGGGDSSSDEEVDDPVGDGGDAVPVAHGPYEGVGEGPIAFWESFDTLQTLVDQTPDGGLLDLTGRGFAARIGDGPVQISSRNLRIRGGHVTGAVELAWTPMGGGLYEAPVDLASLSDFRVYLIDPQAEEWPLLAQVPSPPTFRHFDRFSYNSNWWLVNKQSQGIDNGVVITSEGDDVQGAEILGIRVTDPGMRNEITSALNGETASSVAIMYHAGPNVITTDRVASWSASDGTMMFEGLNSLTYNRYFRFSLVGNPIFISQPGDYAIDLENQRVVYHPSNGDPSRARLSMTPQLIRLTAADVEFESTTLTGNVASTGGTGMIAAAVSPMSRLGMVDCHLHSCMLGVSNAMVDIEDSVVERSSDRGISVVDGSRVVNSVFRDIENRSAIIVMCDGSDPSGAIEQTVIRGNYFRIPSSVHGQGVSLYKDSWQNTVIEHNIFDDCPRAISFQPDTSAASRRSSPGSLLIANNLIICDDQMDTLPGGQSVLSFNGAQDTHLPQDTLQKVTIKHNTVVVFEDVIVDPSSYTLWTIDIRKLVRSEVRVEGNLAGLINASEQADEIGSLPHWHSGNLIVFDRYGASYGEYDLPSPESLDQILDRATLEPISFAAGASEDGGSPGIRWESVPDRTTLDALPVRWSDLHPASPLPSAGSGGFVFFGEDRR